MSFKPITKFKAYNEPLITEEKDINYHICSLSSEENQALNDQMREYQGAYDAYVQKELSNISPKIDILLNEKQRKLDLVFKEMFTHNPKTLEEDNGSLKQNAYDLFLWSSLLRLKKQLNKIKKIFIQRQTQLQQPHLCKIEWMNKSIKWLKRFDGHSYLRWGSALFVGVFKPTLLLPSSFIIIPISYLMPKIQSYTSTQISRVFNTIESQIRVEKCTQRLSEILFQIKQEEKFIIHSMLARLHLISSTESFSSTNLILSNPASRIEIEKSSQESHDILKKLNSEEITSETFDRFHYNLIAYLLDNKNELEIKKKFDSLSWISTTDISLRENLQTIVGKVEKLKNKLIEKNNNFQQNLEISLNLFRKTLVIIVKDNKHHSIALEKLRHTKNEITYPTYFNDLKLLDIAKYKFALKKIDQWATLDHIIQYRIPNSQPPKYELIELATLLKEASGFLLQLKEAIEKPHADLPQLEGFRLGWKEILEEHLQEFIDYGNTILKKIHGDLKDLETSNTLNETFLLCNYPPLVEPFQQILMLSMKELPKPIPLIQKQVICNLNLSDLPQNIQDIKNLSFSLLTHELKNAKEFSDTLKHLFGYTLLLTTPENKKHLQLILETWNMTNPPNKIERLQHAIQSLWKENSVEILLNTLIVMLNQIDDPLSPHLLLLVEYDAHTSKNNPHFSFETISTETCESKKIIINDCEIPCLTQLWIKQNKMLPILLTQKIMQCLSTIKDNHSKSSHQITTIITDLTTHLEKIKAFAKLDTHNLENYKELNDELEKFLKGGNYPLNNKIIENFLLMHEEMLHPKENFLFKYAKFYIQKAFKEGILSHESFCYKNILTHSRVKKEIQPYFLIKCKKTKALHLKITHISILKALLVKEENEIDLLNCVDYENALEQIEDSFLSTLGDVVVENGKQKLDSPRMDISSEALKHISKLYFSAPEKTFIRIENKLLTLLKFFQNTDDEKIAKIFACFGTQADLQSCHFYWFRRFLDNAFFIKSENPYFFKFLEKTKDLEQLVAFFGTQHLKHVFELIENYIDRPKDSPLWDHHLLFLENVFACTHNLSLGISILSSDNSKKFYYLRSCFKTFLDTLLNRRAIEKDPLDVFKFHLDSLQSFPLLVLQEFKKSLITRMNDHNFLSEVKESASALKETIDELALPEDSKKEFFYLLENLHSIKAFNDWVETIVKIIEYNNKDERLLKQKSLINELMIGLFESGENYKNIPYLNAHLKVRFISFLESLRYLNANFLELEIFDQLEKLCFSNFMTRDHEKLVELYDAYKKKIRVIFFDKH